MMSLPFAATILDAAGLADELDRFHLLKHQRFNELASEFPGGGATGLAQFLVARGELTAYQAERALSGQARSLAVGPYRLLEPHHVGAFGPIFRASKGKQQFAIRVLPLRSLWQAKQAKQLVRTLSGLSANPSIVPLVDADSANGFHYLVWPLVDGELLADRVAPGSLLSPTATAQLLASLAGALAECHARQVVHGLLTPQTIVWNPNELPRLLEFGAGLLLARNLAVEESLFDTMSSSLAVAGAFDFSAPEWVADPANPMPASDQYSLGAIGFFALTGLPPSLTANASRELERRTIPAGLAAVIARMLNPDPAARFSCMDEAREVLAELVGMVAVPGSEASFELEPTSRRSGSGSDSAQSGVSWVPPAALLRPAERDGTEASVHFELPDESPEPIVAVPSPESVETPRPAPWATSTVTNRPIAAAPPEVRKNLGLLPPPELPAAPLPPLPTKSPSSGQWNAATAKLVSVMPSSERPSGTYIWKKMKRKVLFWQTPGDQVQVSVFGPAGAAHTQTPKLTVFLHSPSVADSVGTLVRAFHHDAILLGTAPLARELIRGSHLDVHVTLAHTSVTNPLGAFKWKGQPHRLTFDLVVPWEAPVGPALGVVSIGYEEVRIGKVEFAIPILDGKG